MPAQVEKRDDKWRVVEPDGTLIRRSGKPVDGGGHETKEKARRQARAVNANNE